jgi:hypothetical protein
VSQSPGAGNVQDIKDGTESAEFAYPFSLIFHVMLDAMARGMLGKDTSAEMGWKFSPQLMIPSNVNSGTFNANGTTEAPGVTDFFKGIWSS